MKTRPILFNTGMVQAILDGRKTQTRRVVKPQPERGVCNYEWRPNQKMWMAAGSERVLTLQMAEHCPYGIVGDSLWARETWANDSFDHEYGTERLARYKADVPNGGGPWIPSIHMPRWASRITLELMDVRVEQAQDISEADILAEGIDEIHISGAVFDTDFGNFVPKDTEVTDKERFIYLWDSINAKRGYGWDVNPWVWMLEFKRVEGRDGQQAHFA